MQRQGNVLRGAHLVDSKRRARAQLRNLHHRLAHRSRILLESLDARGIIENAARNLAVRAHRAGEGARRERGRGDHTTERQHDGGRCKRWGDAVKDPSGGRSSSRRARSAGDGVLWTAGSPMFILSRALAVSFAPSRQLSPLARARTAVSCTSVTDVEEAPPPILLNATRYFTERGVTLHSGRAAQPGSRTTSRLAVRATDDGTALIGMFQPGTHQVVPCVEDERCHIPHHPAINEALAALQALLATSGLSAYDERTARGTLRYLQLSVERASRHRDLCTQSFCLSCYSLVRRNMFIYGCPCSCCARTGVENAITFTHTHASLSHLSWTKTTNVRPDPRSPPS